MLSRAMKRRSATMLVGLTAAALIEFSSRASSQEVSIGIGASATDLQRLAPDAPTASSSFDVTDATDVLFDVVSTTPGIGAVDLSHEHRRVGRGNA